MKKMNRKMNRNKINFHLYLYFMYKKDFFKKTIKKEKNYESKCKNC